jgi:hypothetical protein
MSSSNLIRWSGLAALVGGALFIILDILESLLFGSQSYAQAAATGPWIVVQGLYLFSAVLLAFGLLGLYVIQAKQASTLGLVAFVVAFIGLVMTAGAVWSEAFFGGWLAGEAPQLLESDPTGALAIGLILTFLLFGLGWLLFGLASLRAGVIPRGSAVLLAIGAVLYPVLGALSIPLAGLVFGAAVVWMGYWLWSGIREGALRPEAAMSD